MCRMESHLICGTTVYGHQFKFKFADGLTKSDRLVVSLVLDRLVVDELVSVDTLERQTDEAVFSVAVDTMVTLCALQSLMEHGYIMQA